jgi:signal transduction histidine kinase
MKSLRHLIALNAVLLLALGFGMALFAPNPLPVVYTQYQGMATIRFLGTIVGGFGITLFMLRNLIFSDERRRLALGLCAANTLIALMAMGQELAIGWVPPLGWFLILVPLGMAVATGWAGLRPARLAEEAETLPIPEEVRRSWLRQIGEAAVQEERNRLSRDLHDSIKQQLFTINVSTAAAQELWDTDPERAKAALVDVRRSAREAMVEMQALLHQLQPKALAAAGLVEALREQCEALGYRTGAGVSLELGESIPDDRLLPGAQETLLRIAQEALANVARHARARTVRVWLGRAGDSALLRIEDDGQGFDPAAATSGMGLRNLRERAQSLSGTLEIQSAAGSGTTICARAALRAPVLPNPLSPVEKHLKWLNPGLIVTGWNAVHFWLARPLLTRSQSYFHLLLALTYALVPAVWAFEAGRQMRSATEKYPAPATTLSSLCYRVNRARVFFLLTATWWAPWYWRFDEPGWRLWTVFWIAAAVVFAGMTVAELVKLHRASDLRRRWLPRSWVWPTGWEQSGYAIVFVVLIGCVMGLPLAFFAIQWLSRLDPIETLLLAFGASVLGYILTRQPRAQGAPA